MILEYQMYIIVPHVTLLAVVSPMIPTTLLQAEPKADQSRYLGEQSMFCWVVSLSYLRGLTRYMSLRLYTHLFGSVYPLLSTVHTLPSSTYHTCNAGEEEGQEAYILHDFTN